MNKEIDSLLLGDEPQEALQSDDRTFNPKFNVREEFVLWAEKQFPELKKHSSHKDIYAALEERRSEVYQAALGAINHGVESTEACASAKLYSGWQALEEGFKENADPKKRAKSLEEFVHALKDLSLSLGGDNHYTDAGRFLDGSGTGSRRFGRLNAFVYRIGNPDDKKATYQVYDTAPEKENLPEGVLIGEFIRMDSWNLKDLKRIASHFKGTEKDFIALVDRTVPEEGVYSVHSYYPTRSISTKPTVKQSTPAPSGSWFDFFGGGNY